MARTLTESPITTRNARSKLPVGLHWRGLDREVHLGYRKGKRGGVWLVRWRSGEGYRQKPIGTADDEIAIGSIDFNGAVKAARGIVEQERLDEAARAAGPVLTVRSAVETYIAVRDGRDSRRAGRQVSSDASTRLTRHVLGRGGDVKRKSIAAKRLADIPLHRLAERDLRVWLEGLEGLRETAKQRLVNDLKAALNAAYSDNREHLPPDLSAKIKHGLRLQRAEEVADDVARENQVLTDGQIERLLVAAREVDALEGWDGDLFRMVLVLAATGARFSQVARMHLGDCQVAARRLLVPPSRKGKGAKAAVITVPVGADVIEALVPAFAGRVADAPLLERWRHRQAPGGISWERDKRGPWLSSSELVRPWRTIRSQAGLPNVIPYALRHSSIVKSIRANLPIRLVAALHDTSTVMIERHYAKWITTGLEEMARGAIVPLVPPSDGDNVVQLTGAGR